MQRQPNTGSLEDILRQDRKNARRAGRKARLRRLIPLCLILALLAGGLIWLIGRLPKSETPTVETRSPDEESVTLRFVGDIALSRQAQEAFRGPAGFDFSPCFRPVIAKLFSADLTVGNLEGNLTDDASVDDNNYPYDLLTALSEAGFDVLQTGNSRSIQNGITGLKRTRSEIEAAGMGAVGTCVSEEEYKNTGGVLIREVGGIRFAFVAFTKGMANNQRIPDEADWCVNLLYTDDVNYTEVASARIARTVDKAKAMQPDVIVALVHWGSEYTEEITDSQREIASVLMENGVSLIVGSHSHYVGPIVRKLNPASPTGTTVIAYGLGDFLSMADTSGARSGCMLRVSFARRDGRIVISDLGYTPTYSTEPSERLDCSRWEVLDSLQAVRFYREQYYDSVSKPLYELLTELIDRMKTQTDAPDLQDPG